jgi:hypothetical protein
MHHRFTATAALLALASAALGQAIHVPSLAITGAAAGDQFGASVRAAGDVNNDGFDDFVVGSRFDGNTASNTGSARVYSGADGAILFIFDGDAADDYFGISVSGAGDVNNDGFADLIVGAPGANANTGLARVLSGADGSILRTLNGDAAGDFFGVSVSGAGDVNNDGFADLIVGADGDDNNGADSGSARVFSGATGAILYTFNGDSASDFFGGCVSGAGDVNNDGFDDLIVGAIGDDNNGALSGSARVFSGANGAILYTFNGDSADDQFGSSASGAGDVNNDGFDDLIVGATLDDNNGSNSGSARVFSGANGSILYTFNGDSEFDFFGVSVSGAGDVNGDGFDDLIAGAYFDNNNGSNSGSARVFSGANGSILDTFDGDSLDDQFGFAVSGAGDVNNDGFADFIVGARLDDNNGVDSGSVRVFLSVPTPAAPTTCPGDATGDSIVNFADLNAILSNFGDACTPGTRGLAAAVTHIPSFPVYSGETGNDQLGTSVSGAGDVNNDGFDDLIVGAPLDDNLGSNSGSARVYSGATGAILYTFNGELAGDQFGLAVSGAGDVNGDGFDDLIISAPLADTNGNASGSVRVVSGANGAPIYTLHGDSAGDEFGRSVSGAGDVNGDSFDDFIVGAPLDDNNGATSGSARVFSGVNGSVLYTFNGDSAGDEFGRSVSGAGDVNNDGFADLVVGVPFDDNNGAQSGSARVFSGVNGSVLYTFDGSAAGVRLGNAVSDAGDVNNDGFGDVIVGASADGANGPISGSATVFSGANGAILHAFNGDSSLDQLGASVSGAGDVNGDGLDDLFVGIPFDDNNGTDSGSARVFSGADGAILYTFNGASPGIRFGLSVSGGGDINNDGFDDLFVGAPLDDGFPGVNSGSARFFFSVPLPDASSCPGDVTGDNIVNFADLNAVLSNFGNACTE